jgi:hypothetical protein
LYRRHRRHCPRPRRRRLHRRCWPRKKQKKARASDDRPTFGA